MNLHWFDVRESYFNAYCQHLGGGYRAPEGKIYDYDEVKKSAMYQKPFYKEMDKNFADEEAHRYLFKSNEDWNSVKKTLQSMKRTLVPVSF